MQSDLPHTLYNFKKKSDAKGATFSRADLDEAERLNIAAMQKRKKRQQEEGYTIDEIFNRDADEE